MLSIKGHRKTSNLKYTRACSTACPVEGQCHEFDGGGQCIGRWGVNTVKTLKLEKGGGA